MDESCAVIRQALHVTFTMNVVIVLIDALESIVVIVSPTYILAKLFLLIAS
jgi:hypothetical protein